MEKIEDVEMDQGETLALFFMRSAAAALLIDDLLQGLRQICRRKAEMAFGGDFLCEPRVQQVVARAECDGAGTDDRDHCLHFHAIEELVPKRMVQFSDHHWSVNRVRHRFLDIRYFTVPLVLKMRLSQQRRLDAAHMRYLREQVLSDHM